MITIGNELLRVTTKTGRTVVAGSTPEHGQIVLHLTGGFRHSALDTEIEGPLVEVQRYREEEEEPYEVEHIRWAAVESVAWSGELA